MCILCQLIEGMQKAAAVGDALNKEQEKQYSPEAQERLLKAWLEKIKETGAVAAFMVTINPNDPGKRFFYMPGYMDADVMPFLLRRTAEQMEAGQAHVTQHETEAEPTPAG